MKKVVLFIFSLVCVFSLFCALNVKAAALSLIMTDGASVRTEGEYQGLRFQAVFNDDLSEPTEYGFYLAAGSHTKDEMISAISAGTRVGGNKIVKSSKVDTERMYYVTVYDIASTYYTTDITALAFYKKGSDNVYSDIAVTKNIAEVSMNALNHGESADLLTNVATYLGSNYMIIPDGVNQFYEFTVTPFNISKSSFSDLSDLYEEFIDDYNDATGEALTTSSTISEFSSSLTSGINENDYKIDADDNLAKMFSGLRLIKWKWLVEYFSTCDTEYYNYAASALLNGNRTSERELKSCLPLAYSFWNFFHTTSLTTTYQVARFNNEASYSSTIWQKYSSYSHNTCVLIGDTIELPSAPTKNGYAFVEYSDGVNTYNPGDSISVTSSTICLESVFNLENYTITYNLNGGSNSLSNVGEYNIESSEITLYDATKDGYIFGGWYDNSGFVGSAITSIPSGSYGNKVLYAKWNEVTPTNLDVSSADVSVLNTITPDIIVKEGIEAGRYYLNGAGLNASYTSTYYTVNTNAFTNIAAALEEADVDDIIYVFSGTYSNALSISKSVSIIGPNYNILGTDTREDEAIITNTITIAADDVNINGIKISGGNIGIAVSSAISNLSIKNVYASVAKGVELSSYYGLFVSTGAINGLEISGLYIYLSNNESNAAIYCSNIEYITNAVINNNHIESNTNGNSSNSAIRIEKITGKIEINNNEIIWPTNDSIIYLGRQANTCTEIVIVNNSLRGRIVNGNIEKASNCYVMKISTGCTVNVIGNYFEYFNSANNTITLAGKSGNTGVVNVKYNYFGANVAYKGTPSNVTYSYDYNFYIVTPDPAIVEEHTLANLSTLISAYKASGDYATYGSVCVYE